MKRITTKSSNPNEERQMSKCRCSKCLFYAELTEEFNFDDDDEVNFGPRLSLWLALVMVHHSDAEGRETHY